MHCVEQVGQLLQHRVITAAAARNPYQWPAVKVREVLDSLQLSIDHDWDDFFIGAIILVQDPANTDLEDIADGHHRLVTLSMLRDQIKDRLCSLPRDTGTLDKSLRRASDVIDQYLERLLAPWDEWQRETILLQWLAFVEHRVLVVALRTPPAGVP